MADFTAARIGEIEEIEDGRCPFRPVRHALGITSFGVTALTARAAGDRIVNEHREDEPGDGEELYVVMSGHATFELDGESLDAPTGTVLRVAPGVTRTAFARESGTTVLAVGAGAPGDPYQASGWELFAPLMPLFAAGEYELGADRAAEMLASDPPYPGLWYNAACLDSRAGRPADALAHLRRGLELDPSLARLARSDEDLAPLRDAEPAAFAELVGEPG